MCIANNAFITRTISRDSFDRYIYLVATSNNLGYKAYKSPSAKLYQIFGFIILIYFMSACLIVFGLPDASLLSWLELIEIVALFLVAVYAAREQLNVK